MAFQPVPNTASFRMVGGANTLAVAIVNTLYIRNSAGWTSALLTAAATALGNAWRDQLCPLFTTDYLFDRVEAKDEGSEFGAQEIVEYNTAGGTAPPALSAALCMYVKLKGSGGSAPRDGGLFLSPFAEADIAVDSWVTSKVTAVQTAIQAVFNAGDGAQVGNAMVIVSRYSKSAVPVAPHKRTTAVTNTVATETVSSKLAIQRDRRLGHGS